MHKNLDPPMLRDSLRRPKGVDVLLALSEGPKQLGELQTELGGDPSIIEQRIQDLLSVGLVRERKDVLDAWFYGRIFDLSEKGREIARTIKLQRSLLELTPSESGRDWILALLHASGGKIRGRLRIQKLMFLLKHGYKIEVPYNFIPYAYGPYCADIFEDLTELKEEGLVGIRGEGSELHEMAEDPKTMSFFLTEKGKEEASRVYRKLPSETRMALIALNARFNRMSLRDLIRYVYENYPESSL